jgi:hypothetical protein
MMDAPPYTTNEAESTKRKRQQSEVEKQQKDICYALPSSKRKPSTEGIGIQGQPIGKGDS